MGSGVYDRTKSKPNSGIFKKGEHRNPSTEFKKGIHPKNVWVKGIGYTGIRDFYTKDTWKYKQSESHKGKHYSPRTEFKKGQHISPNTEFKELVPGGISSEETRFRNSPEYREWRIRIFERDNYTCQRCGIRGGRLTAHHIKFFVTHPELRLFIDNGITYCKSCHHFEHAKLKILETLEKEYQSNRRSILILRLETLEKYNQPAIVKERQTFISYSVNPLTLESLPKKKTQKAIIKEIQLAFNEEVMLNAK
jgi:hypothetical protein